MKLTTAIFVLSGLCSTVTSSPILAERAACTIKLQDVNVSYLNTRWLSASQTIPTNKHQNWVEAALLRYRHLPSIVGTPATSDAGDVHKMLQQNWKKGLDAFGGEYSVFRIRVRFPGNALNWLRSLRSDYEQRANLPECRI